MLKGAIIARSPSSVFYAKRAQHRSCLRLRGHQTDVLSPETGKLDGIMYRSYLPGNSRKRSMFLDHLVIPQALTCVVPHACPDYAVPGGHLANKLAYDKMRGSGCRNIISTSKHGAQTGKRVKGETPPHNRAKLLMYHLTVDRPFCSYTSV